MFVECGTLPVHLRFQFKSLANRRHSGGNGSIDETLYAIQDANWDITALADTSGTVMERFRYDPYGRSLVLEEDFAVDPDGQSDYDWEYRFTSREYDAETRLHYFRARYWHPDLGRFIGRDPLEYVDGGSLYAGYFVPGGIDPLGLESAGLNHCYPLYLGGASNQPVIFLDEDAHTAFHDYFRDLFVEVKNTRGYGVEPREFWKKLTKAQQKEHITEAMRRAGIDDDTISKNINKIMKGARPGRLTERPHTSKYGPEFGKGRTPGIPSRAGKLAGKVIGGYVGFGAATAFAEGYRGNGKVECEGLGPAIANVAHDAVCGDEVEWLVEQGIYGIGEVLNVNRPAINPKRGVQPDFPNGEGRGY